MKIMLTEKEAADVLKVLSWFESGLPVSKDARERYADHAADAATIMRNAFKRSE
jgi:hypothetical protein